MAIDENRVSGLLKILSPLQEKVVRLYFGLGCQRSHSASEIAREFHVSSQVISGIIGGAERRLAQEGLTPSKLREAASFEAEISRKRERESSVNHLSMGPEEFDVLVERAFKKIPRRFRRRLANVVLVVEQEPPRPNLLGLYQGRPLTHRSVSEGFALPDKITIYQGPHERTARTPSQLEQLVEETVWHEIAHYFGLDEREVRRAEIRRRHLR